MISITTIPIGSQIKSCEKVSLEELSPNSKTALQKMDTRGGTCNSASMIQVPDSIIITINFFFSGGLWTCPYRTSGGLDRAVTLTN